MRRVFDQKLLDLRRTRALARSAPGADFLLTAAVGDLVDRLAAVKRRFDRAVEIATPGPGLGEAVAAAGLAATVVRIDRLAGGTLPSKSEPDVAGVVSEAFRSGRPAPAAHATVLTVAGDAEALPIAAESIDLAVSALGLQLVDDLPGVFAQIRRALRPDGLFLAALLGGQTLHELRAALAGAEAEIRGGAAPRVAPFADLRDLAGLLQRAGFALPVADLDRLVVRYDSALALMQDLRAMGAANALLDRDRRPLTRAILARAVSIYAERFADPDGRVRATFEVISLSGWAPDPGQQQPLRPGSARARLADALGVPERPAGEKAGR